MIVHEKAESALRRVALGRANAEVEGGGFAGAIGSFERTEIEFEIVGMRENNAGGGGLDIGVRGVLVNKE